MSRKLWALVGAWSVVVSLASPATAQTTPRIEFIWPPGAAKGSEVEAQVAGEFAPDDVSLHVSGTGIEVVRPLGRLRYLLRVSSDATVGTREFRLVATQGASAPFPFLIGELPETTGSVLPADRAQPTPLRTVINGCLSAPASVAEFPVELAAGQTITCVVHTRSIRSPLEPLLRLLNAAGRAVAHGVDARSADAVLTYRATKAEKLTLQLLDFQGNGSPAHLYRLLLTDGPWLDHAFPWLLSAEKETPVTVTGWNLPNGKAAMTIGVAAPSGVAEVLLPGEVPAVDSLRGVVRPLRLAVTGETSVVEVEPNDTQEMAGEFSTLPLNVVGKLESRGEDGDQDLFVFTAKKAETLVVDVDAADRQSPVDAVLAVLDAAGKKLVEQDDVEGSRDPLLRFAAPADGRYCLAIRERSSSGGPDYVYQIRISSPRPDVKARVNTMSLYIEAGRKAILPVVVQRVEGYAGELELTAVDLPTGVTVVSEKVPEKTPATVNLQFSAEQVRGASGGLARVVVRSSSGVDIVSEAVIAESSAANAATTRGLWVCAGPAIPFTLKTTTTILEAPRMAAFPFPVQVDRLPDFSGPIRLVGVEPDRRGTVRPLAGEIPANSQAGSLPLVIQQRVIEGTTHRCRVMGVAEVAGMDGRTYQLFHVAPGAMAMGCEPNWLSLLAQPASGTWRPNERVKVEVQLTQRVPLGAVSLRLEPPAGSQGVECDVVIAPLGARTAQLELRLGAEVVLPPRAVFTVKAKSAHQELPVFGETTFRLDRD